MQDSNITKLVHDLKQPITVIKGYLAMVLDGTTGQISEKAKKYLQKAYDSNEELIKMIKNLSLPSSDEEGN